MAFKEETTQATTVAVENLPPSTMVVQEIADIKDMAPTELSPLYEAIDPDALNTLFQGKMSGSVTFEYEGYTVTVEENSEVTVQT